MLIPASAISPFGNLTSRTTSDFYVRGSSTQWTKVSSKSKITVLVIKGFLGFGSKTDLDYNSFSSGTDIDFMYYKDCNVWSKWALWRSAPTLGGGKISSPS